VPEAPPAWKILLGKYGTTSPGPAPHGMARLPPASRLAAHPLLDWHRAGVRASGAQTIMRASSVADSLERLLDLGHAAGRSQAADAARHRRVDLRRSRQRAAAIRRRLRRGYHLSNVGGSALAGRIAPTTPSCWELLKPYEGTVTG